MTDVRKAALRLALEFLKPYVLRGDSEESTRKGMRGSTRKGMMGFGGGGNHIHIGNYARVPGQVALKKMKPDDVVVEYVNDTACFEVFKLSSIYKYINDAAKES